MSRRVGEYVKRNGRFKTCVAMNDNTPLSLDVTRRDCVLSKHPGGILSAQQCGTNFMNTTRFIENTAVDSGGAISIANPDNLNVNGGTFTSNTAEFGGAVCPTSI